jgi:hypothetical protein
VTRKLLRSRRRTRGVWLTLIPVLLAASCTNSGTSPVGRGQAQNPTSSIPCAQPATTTEDLRSYLGTSPATFTTDGTALYVLLTKFEHGGLFDPKTGASEAYFGSTDALPSWDAQRNIVTNTIKQDSVTENRPLRVDLPAGSYWIWVSNFPVIQLISCTAKALTNVTPATPT